MNLGQNVRPADPFRNLNTFAIIMPNEAKPKSSGFVLRKNSQELSNYGGERSDVKAELANVFIVFRCEYEFHPRGKNAAIA